RTFIGTMRFLAGYDGCTDSTYVEYNPKATHMATGACVNPTFIQVGSLDGKEGIKLDALKIAFYQPRRLSVEICHMTGAEMAARRGEGPREYRFAEITKPGVYVVRIVTDNSKVPYNRKLVLL